MAFIFLIIMTCVGFAFYMLSRGGLSTILGVFLLLFLFILIAYLEALVISLKKTIRKLFRPDVANQAKEYHPLP